MNYRVKLLKAPRLGLCSNFLSRLEPGQHKVPIWVKPGTLRFPKDPKTPVVMVGPGTGVAPFRAYAWQQHAMATGRRMVLFFGCRGRHKDFYFKDEWSKIAGNPGCFLLIIFSKRFLKALEIQFFSI